MFFGNQNELGMCKKVGGICEQHQKQARSVQG